MRIDRRAVTIVCALVATTAAAVRAQAPEVTWRNHIDASMINEIVPRGDVLYMATFGGLVLYDVGRGTFDQYDTVSGLPSSFLTCLLIDAEDNIYLGTEDIGIVKVRVSPGRLTLIRALNEQIDGLASNSVNSVATWGEDIVYGSTPGAGTIRKDFASARYFKRDGLPAADVRDVLPDGDFVWLATDSGLAVLDRFGLLRQPSGGPPRANVLASDGSRIWVGTGDGVWRLDPSDSSWTNVGPAAFPIYSLTWDGTTMWGGSTRVNLFRYDGTGTDWTWFQQASSIFDNYRLGDPNGHRLRSVAVLPSGDVYVGTAQPGERRGLNLIRYQGTAVTNLIPNAPGSNQIWRLSVDIDDSVWCTSADFFVGKLTPSGSWVNHNPTVPGIELPSSQYANLTMLADSDGIKWMCTLSTPTGPVPLDALDDKLDADYSNDSWQRFGIDSGGGDRLQSLRLQRAAEDPAGNRWFLSDDEKSSDGWWGIQILSKDRSQWLTMSPSKDARMVSGNVRDVAFSGTFAYVGLKEDGVQVWGHNGYTWSSLTNLTGDSWSHPVTADSLSTQATAEVTALALRSDGVLWIGTSVGLFRYEPGPRRVRKIPQYIGIGPGIINPKVGDIVLDHDENLWVATENGLNRIARDDYNDIQTYTTAAGYLSVAGLRYPLSIITPLANANCFALAMHRSKDVLYVGTYGGLSILDFSEKAAVATDLTRVYVYPNPVYGSRGQNTLKIENLTGPVSIEIYNVEGELVSSSTATANGDVIWDLTTRNGYLVGSGSYLVRISGPDGSVTKPVAVLR